MLKEVELRKGDLTESISTIYFGADKFTYVLPSHQHIAQSSIWVLTGLVGFGL